VAIGDNGTAVATDIMGRRKLAPSGDATKAAFFWLGGFFIVYCARPEDWIPGLQYAPLAKITAILAMWALFNNQGRLKRTFKDVPREGKILFAMICLLFVSAALSPIWRGGSLNKTMDFSKVFVAWVLTFLLITTFERLRKIIFIQAASVVVVASVSIIKGHNTPRLQGVLGGIYSNPNDLAFALVLSLPFALAFMVTARSAFVKALWLGGMLIMSTALFMTASRAGFLNLLITGTVTLYHFGIKGKRYYLIATTLVVVTLLMATVGGKLYDRFHAISGDAGGEESAEASYEARKYLMERALVGIEHYPILGLGPRNFNTYSLIWHEVHMTYLQICVEGGIPALVLYLMFFASGFRNLRILQKTKGLDEHTVLFIGALHSSLVGFAVGALFAPEAYQYFPYFAVAFTATLLQTVREREREQGPGPAAPAPKKPRHFLEAYADDRRTAPAPVR
jgi:O-antigen ligase